MVEKGGEGREGKSDKGRAIWWKKGGEGREALRMGKGGVETEGLRVGKGG